MTTGSAGRGAGQQPGRGAEPFVVRQLRPDDLAALEALEASQTHRLSRPQALEQAFVDEQRLLLGVEGSNGGLAAYALVSRLPFEAELEAILVATDARRQGLGRLLLSQLVEQARDWGAERLLLEVRADNAEAIALYRALGFTQDGLRRAYYAAHCAAHEPGGERVDAVLMSLTLA
ncbi:GNAT family N-acetyltransferase [Halomonas denitrificans]|uniref:GNAT family N-acetyltransferase n=1 Tax=Halomonas TaxID=2745 RepID=UPI001C99263B|nr:MULTISPECIES: GNAT family N-acetyltransferase [Halomonas]MBY5985507.1 GNAT family N-acetyltransferase [Halomonas sp. DP5Y7-2]MCA0975925.1 GNAT family N-acetyltransferase [Halomonas denitrificans]